MCQIDDAAKTDEFFLQKALEKRNLTIKPIGICYFCYEEIELKNLFCDSDCRDDWQKQEDHRKRVGK